jgi:tetratricopeptide (TPR) repeat protein
MTRDKSYLDMLDNYAYALDAVGRSREAAAIQRREMVAMDSSGRSGMLDGAIMWHNYALILTSLGETAAAESFLHRALERFERSDPSGRLPWQEMIHYAEAALAQAQADSALKYFRAVVERGVAEKKLYWEGRGRFGEGRALVRLGRLPEAKQVRDRLAKVIELYPDVRDTEDQLPDAHVLSGWIALAEGDGATTRAEALTALRANGYFEGKDHKRLFPVVLLAAEGAQRAGQATEALDYARQALKIATIDSLAAFESALAGEAELVEARALLARGDTVQARSTLTQAVGALQHGAGPEHPTTRFAQALVDSLAR